MRNRHNMRKAKRLQQAKHPNFHLDMRAPREFVMALGSQGLCFISSVLVGMEDSTINPLRHPLAVFSYPLLEKFKK